MKKSILLVLILSFAYCNAQDSYKNVVRWNVTPTLVSGAGSWMFGYERVLSDRTSFSINVGRVQFPILTDFSSGNIQFIDVLKNNGFSFSGDYRMYFRSRNSMDAPGGVYWAPFVLFYNFDMAHRFEFEGESATEIADVETVINAYTMGVELGYQFTLGKRWTVDLVFLGPCMGLYTVNANLNGNLPNEFTNSQAWEAARDYLQSSYPNAVSRFEDGTFSSTGRSHSWGFNFRYVLQVGYRF